MLDAFYAGVTSCVDPDCRKSLKVPDPSSRPLLDLPCLPRRLAGKSLTEPHEVTTQRQSYDADSCARCSPASIRMGAHPCPVDWLHLVLRVSSQAMADLFALKCIYEEALFRNDDYVSPEKAKAIARMIEELCLEVRRRTLLYWLELYTAAPPAHSSKPWHNFDMMQHHFPCLACLGAAN